MSKKNHDEEGFMPIPEKPVETAVATVESHLPANMSDCRGFEEPVDQSDLIIPRAKLLQPTADELTQEGNLLRSGMVINSLTKTELSKVFTPIFYYKEYMRFNGRKKEDKNFNPEFAPGVLMWRTRDANDSRVLEQCSFGPNGEAPIAITSLNFLCLFEGESMPTILSFTKSSYRAGKNLLSLAKLRGGAMFSRKYRLGVVTMKGDEGNYYVLKVDPAGDCDPETFKTAEGYFTAFAPKRDSIVAHVEDIA